MKKYLETWTDGYPEYDKQYLAANIIINSSFDKESLLPVRFRDDLTLFYNTRFEEDFEVGNLYGSYPWTVNHRVCVEDGKYTFAKALYKKASQKLFDKYPDIDKIGFDSQQKNGVYNICWKYPPSFLKEKLLEIMGGMIRDGFCINEHIEHCNVNERIIRFDGVMHYDDRKKLFGKYKYDSIPDAFHNTLTYSLEECMPYYTVISDDILNLGNQQRIYSMTYEENKPLFDAANSGDVEKLCRLAEKGYNLNAMTCSGDTPLYLYVDKFLFDEEEEEYYGVLPEHIKNNIEKLMSYGANPAVCGVTNWYSPLIQQACVCSNVGLVRFLLEKGVNPNQYMYLDDYYCEKDNTLTEWVECHIEPDEFGIDDDDKEMEERRIKYTAEIYQLLKKYL